MFEDHFQHNLSAAGKPSDISGWVFLLHIYAIHKQAFKNAIGNIFFNIKTELHHFSSPFRLWKNKNKQKCI